MKDKFYGIACSYYQPGSGNFTEMQPDFQRELPALEVNISSTWYRYAPEPDGSYIQEVEGALSGTLYKHTIGSLDCKTLKTFLPYYGVEINNPVRTWPFTMPTSVTIERKLYPG